MRICSFNVNSIRSRLEIVKNLIKDFNIDIICMQEIKVENDKFPKLFDDIFCVVNGQKRFNGVATCSFYPIDEYEVGWDEARFIYTKIASLNIINIYAPLGDLYDKRFEYKMEFYKKLMEYLKKYVNEDTIICGDFNISHTHLDVWDEELWEGEVTHLKEEQEIFTQILELGYIDVIREFYPNEKIFTFYDYREGRVYKNEGLRLDYFLVSKSLINRVKGVEILTKIRRKRKPTPSDHVPIILELI